jgi:hypothetical protein
MSPDKKGEQPSQPHSSGGKQNQPPNPEGANRATQENDLTTGHSEPDDGGDDNAK